MNKWSHSRLNLYSRCPQAYRFRYLDGEPEQVSEALLRGSQFHEWAEAYAKHCHATGQATDYDKGRQLAASYPGEVREVCAEFLESTKFDWSLAVADDEGIEREFAVELPGNYGLFRGRVDFVEWNEYEAALHITDYKSGHGPYEKPDACPPQLACYAWAMHAQFPAADLVVARYRYIGNAVTHEWEVYEPSPDWALSVIDRIRADDELRATPGKACEWCGYTAICPLVTGDAIVHPTGQGTAEKAWRQLVATKARAAKITDGLKGYLKERKPLMIDVREVAGYGLPPEHDEYEVRPGSSPEEVLAALRDATEGDRSLWAVVKPSALGKLKDVAPEAFFVALREAGYSEEDLRKLFDAKALGKKLAEAGSMGFGDEPGAERLEAALQAKQPSNRFSVRT